MGKEKESGGCVPPDFWVWTLAMAAMLYVLGVSLSGCSRAVYVPVEAVRADTVWRSKAYADSTYLMDSLVVTLDLRRDTVVRTEYRYRTHWRERTVTDTLWRTRTDSVRVEVPVEREPTRWEKARMAVGDGAMAAVLAVAAFFLGKLARKAGRN